MELRDHSGPNLGLTRVCSRLAAQLGEKEQSLRQRLREWYWESGAVTCFAVNSLEASLLACWGPQYKEPWLIVTDLPPEQASATWYGMRTWIEGGFKDIKRDGWQWQKTRMTDPVRATRFWLALAVATLWVVCAGSEADQNLPVASLLELPPAHVARRTKKSTFRGRTLSCFSRCLD